MTDHAPTLTPIEGRVLGVLVEKALTTPTQYPMTLNALVAGCNQKSNRNPAMDLSEEAVLDAIESLQAKQYTRTVFLEGSRVPKYRHVARDVLEIDMRELAVLAELLLRGPRTIGEIRGRASRMQKIESLDVARNLLESLMQREGQPLVRRVAPAPGTRAERFMQLLAPNAHHVEPSDESGQSTAPSQAPAASSSGAPAAAAAAAVAATTGGPEVLALQERIDHLESRIDRLTEALDKLAASLGEEDPWAND